MTKEELKALGLTDEQADKIVADYGKNYVAKSQFNTKNEELKHAKEESEAVAKQLEELKKANEGNKDLAAQLEKMKTEAETRKKEYTDSINQMKLDNAVDIALNGFKAKNAKAVRALLDLKEAKVGDDGKVAGLDEQLKKLQESDPYLFNTGTTGVSGLKAGEGSDGKTGGEGGATVADIFTKALG